MEVRAAEAGEIDNLASLWHDSWQDAHAQILAELTRLRTLESFRDRHYQLFVAAASRGSGIAAALTADAEARLSESGVATAWLACAIGNERAARFYEKCGWRRAGTMLSRLATSNGIFPLEVWRYEKSLTRLLRPAPTSS